MTEVLKVICRSEIVDNNQNCDTIHEIILRNDIVATVRDKHSLIEVRINRRLSLKDYHLVKSIVDALIE